MPLHIIELESYLKFNFTLSLQEYRFKFYILSVQITYVMFGNALLNHVFFSVHIVIYLQISFKIKSSQTAYQNHTFRYLVHGETLC